MPLIAIIAAGAGVSKVLEFREAVDAAAAVAEFVSEPVPPLNVVDFVGHNPSWSVVQKPPSGGRWFFDHTTSTLVENLDEIKTAKYAEIDKRTRELIQQGFEFPAASGNFFSLSRAAQSNLHKLQLLKDDPATVYPRIWTRKNDSGIHSIPGATGANAFYTKAVGTIDGHRDSGRTLKDSVRAAVDAAAVAAIIDTR